MYQSAPDSALTVRVPFKEKKIKLLYASTTEERLLFDLEKLILYMFTFFSSTNAKRDKNSNTSSGFQLNFRLSSSKGLSKLYLFAAYSLLKCNFVSCAGRQIKTKMKTRRQMDMSVNPKRWHTRSLSGRRANQNPRNSDRFRLFSFQGQMKTALLSCK